MNNQTTSPEAEELIKQATLKVLDGKNREAVDDYEAALRLGLPLDEEMQTRFFLGESYACLINKQLSAADSLAEPELQQAIGNMERSVVIDRETQAGYFQSSLNRARLKDLDTCYAIFGTCLKEVSGPEAAISFYESKLPLFDHLRTTPLLMVLLQLGALYNNHRHDEPRARYCYQTMVNADIVYPDNDGEAELRHLAQNNLRTLQGTPIRTQGCFIATAVYGSPEAPELVLFRRFRDEHLERHPLSRFVVSGYYVFSPPVARLIAKSPVLRSVARTLLVSPALRFISRALNPDLTAKGVSHV